MSVPDRIYNIAKSYLDAARGRLDEIDTSAIAELEGALAPGGSVSMSDDPMARAAAKIASTNSQAAAWREQRMPVSYSPVQASTPVAEAAIPSDPVATAYKVIGVAPGSDIDAVTVAVAGLRERAAPSRFPEGSLERLEAERIQQRVDQAFTVLQNALGAPTTRFDRLEL